MKKHPCMLAALIGSLIALALPMVAQSTPVPPTSVTTMAMEGGFTFVFQLPAGYKLRERATPMIGCDSMIWMSPDAPGESDGVIFQLGVIKPTADMLSAMQEASLIQLAKSILDGKAEGWAEFHASEPSDLTLSNIRFVRFDFNGVRKSSQTKISGFQLIGQHKDKLINIVLEAPEKLHSEIDKFERVAKTIQIQ